jgi:aspartate kinase
MIVMKFGGTSVGNAERIRDVVKIVKSKIDSKPVVVVSALGGVTDNIIDTANLASNGDKYDIKLNGILQRHYDTIAELGLRPEIISSETDQLARNINNITTRKELTPRDLDKIVSFGERMSARIIAGYLSKMGIPAKAHDSYDIGLITDGNFGDASMLPESYPKIKRSLSNSKSVPVITGFIAKDKNGRITTLGRGGSDYTASIIGAAIGATEIQIWTDVNGIMTADPKIVKNAKSVAIVSYDEASELAFLGAKVLHPKTILPAIENSIPVRILNTFNPTHRGTLVLKDIRVKNRVVSIACKKKIQVINLTTPKMFQMHGFLRQVFETFDKHGVSVDMVSTSEVNVSITMDGKQKTDRLVEDLKGLADVQIMPNRAKVSIVGKHMVYIPGILSKLFSSLDGIYIEMISSSTSEVNDGFVVEEKYADEAVRRLHKSFFGR